MTQFSPLIRLPSWVSTVESAQVFAQASTKIGRSIVSFVGFFANQIPDTVKKVSNLTKLIGGITIILHVPKLINNSYKTATVESIEERVYAAWQAAANIGKIAEGFADTVAGLKVFQWIRSDALSWTHKIISFSFPLQVVGLYLDMQQSAKCQAFYKEMHGRITPLSKKEPSEHRIEHIKKACELVIENKERFKKICLIGNEAKIEERAQKCIHGETSLEEGHKFLKILDRRLTATYSFDVSGIALTAGRIAMTSLGLNLAATPLLVGASIAVNGVGLVHLGLAKFMLNANPFEKSGNCWYHSLTDTVRESLYSGFHDMRKLAVR